METEMVYAPVMITTCNRYEHLRRCIESLKKNTYADRTKLYISVDYPPDSRYEQGWEKVCSLLKEPVEGFLGVRIYFQEKNLGADANYQYLRKIVLQENDRLIYTEDDNEFSVNFLAYMDKGLELFRDHPKVYGICAYADDYHFRCGEDNVVALTDFGGWGMGVWREKEKLIDGLLTRATWIRAAKSVRTMWKLYARRKRLFSRMLGMLLEGEETDRLPDTDINRGIILALNGLCTINPVRSKARNWGGDGSGQNVIGSPEENSRLSAMPLDTDSDFTYRCGGVRTDRYNDRQLDDNDRWNRECARWYRDPLTYVAYRLLGRDRFLRMTHRRQGS